MLSSYNMGYSARNSGTPKEENPFPKVGQMYARWNLGWQHADEEAAIRPVKTITKLKDMIPLKLIK